MKAHVEPVCPFEGCGAWAVHYHRNRRAADFFGACKCRPGDPGHEADDAFSTRCYAPRPGNAKPETDLPHDPWILPTREQVARVLFVGVDDGERWDEVSGVRRAFYLADADAVLALLSPWRLVEIGTVVKAGTRYRVEEASGWCYERTARSDWTVANRSRRVYIDPRTVPAEPDPRVESVAQVLAEKAGISLDEAEAALVVQALDRMGDDSVTYHTTTTAHHMEDL